MAQLFFATAEGNPALYALNSTPVLLSEAAPRLLGDSEVECAPEAVLLRPRESDGARCREWSVEFRHGRRGVWINGLQRTLGFYLLGDDDRVRIEGGCSFVYTNEEMAEASVFPGSEERIECQRCHDEMVEGEQAVRCEICHSWYHFDSESSEDCCWRSAEKCRVCGHPTAMDGTLTRIPEVD